jgi:hypothetical protein
MSDHDRQLMISGTGDRRIAGRCAKPHAALRT